jgi:hypothetical protein
MRYKGVFNGKIIELEETIDCFRRESYLVFRSARGAVLAVRT